MSQPVEFVESGGDEPHPQNLDPKIWNVEAPLKPGPDPVKNLSVISGGELVVDSAFNTPESRPKQEALAKQKPEATTAPESKLLDVKAATLQKAQTEQRGSSNQLEAGLQTRSDLRTFSNNDGFASPETKALSASSSAATSDVIARQITLSKASSPVLPSVDFVENSKVDQTAYKQTTLQGRVEQIDNIQATRLAQTTQMGQASQVEQTVQSVERARDYQSQIVETKPQIIQAKIESYEAPTLLNRMSEVVQNTTRQPDLQIVDKSAVLESRAISANPTIERHEDNTLTIANAKGERPLSARFENYVAEAGSQRIVLEANARLDTRLDARLNIHLNAEGVQDAHTQPLLQTPKIASFIGFSRFVEPGENALQIKASFTPRAFELPVKVENLRPISLQPTGVQPEFVRSPYIASIVKSVLSGLQQAQRTDVPMLTAGPKFNIDAQSIIKANFNPSISSTINGAAIVRQDFTIKAIGSLTDIRSNPIDLRTDIRGPIPSYNPIELSFGKKKKKHIIGRRGDNTCAGSRYISGLELGLIIALAGIAKFDSTDRSNRKVFNSNKETNFANTINKCIENKQLSKRLPSYNWNNEWKSPGKIKVKNALEKIKKERKDLKSKDLEKLESSSNKEELISRLSKLIKQDEKALDAKQLLSGFNKVVQEKFKSSQVKPQQPPAGSNYRPLWLVCENDSLTNLAEQIYQDPDVGWLIADMNISRIRETWMNNKRVIQMQSRQQIELPIQEDIDLFKQNKEQSHCAENLITVVIQNQLDKDHINNQLQALQIKRKALGTT